MANPEHLAILKQGVEAWNIWREKHRDPRPDLRGANLRRALLIHANLSEANLRVADLSGADLREADLSDANLNGADVIGADLSESDLSESDLSEADLSGARLVHANLSEANLRKVNLSEATVRWTIFGDVDLSMVEGLETIRHLGPSTISLDTIYKSGGKIPEAFLRGAGVPDNFITYIRSLVGNPIKFYSCFISYSTNDREFADRLYADLQAKGVRCWFATEDLKVGDKFRDRIDESIRLHDKLLIVLSERSIGSPWVRREVEAAFEREDKQKSVVLFPIRVDDAVMETNEAWAADIRRTRHIGDFSRWKDHDSYRKALERLLRDLKTEAREP